MGTAPGGFYPASRAGHTAGPEPGTAYTVAGPNTGQEANLRNSAHYPAEALCKDCGMMIRSDGASWYHTGRNPGEEGQ